MSYTKQTWIDRVSQYIHRYTKSEDADGNLTFTPAPGKVTTEGTPVTAARLNHMEDGIADVDAALTGHAGDTTNPHGVTAEQAGAPTTEQFTAHTGNKTNPHSVTPAQIGAATTTALTAHTGNKTNPHGVTAAQAGAPTTAQFTAHTGNKTNPHSVTPAQIGAATDAALTAHTGDTANPHGVTPAQIGAAPSAHSHTPASLGAATAAALNAHTGDTANPHGVTAAQAGAPTTAQFTAHTGNTSNPHGVTAAQAGAVPIPYGSLYGTGLATQSCTTAQLIEAMAVNSVICFAHNTSTVKLTDIPFTYGIVIIHKGYNSGYVQAFATNNSTAESYLYNKTTAAWQKIALDVGTMAGKGIQSGSGTVTIPAGSIGSSAFSVTFPKAFTEIPLVFVCLKTNAPGLGRSVAVSSAAADITKTGFKGYAGCASAAPTGGTSVSFEWMAIGAM